jgi:hypothetical protein
MVTATALVHRLRTEIETWRKDRNARRELRRQLSVYTSPADIEQFLATLERHEGPGIAEMRSMLIEQLIRRQRNRVPAPFTS